MTRVAAVDIGTNTVRLLVADHRPSGMLDVGPLIGLDRRTEIVRLGQGVDATGRLDDRAIARTIEALTGFGLAIAAWRPDAIEVVATSATRDAANGAEFLERAALAIGATPVVISGEREATLAFAGATAAAPSDVPKLVIDLGGGSTEFVYGTESVETAFSVQMGSVRLTERTLGEGPLTTERLEEGRTVAAAAIAAHEPPPAPSTVYALAGTFTTLAALHLGLDLYRDDAVHGATIPVQGLTAIAERLASLSVDEIAAIPAVEELRAPVLTGGAVVAEQAALAVGAAQVTISTADLLDGIALSAAGAV